MITPSDVPSRWRKKSPNGFRRRLRLFSCSMGRLKESSPVILLLPLFPLLLHQSLTKVLGESESTRFGFCSSQYLTPFVERERYQIPDKCRLHPDNDLYRDQEQHKVHVDVYEWKCGYCRKSFNEDKFLDQHFATRHFNLLNTTGTKCLADLCGALHCDFVLSSKKAKSKCNPAAAAQNRHLCESLANTCFPVSQGPAASRLHEEIGCLLPRCINTDLDATPTLLSAGLLTPKVP
ncbi:hypothetical protein F2Q68_00017642 [Brassica cretica]|uniref:C2H2-type domain-containing protein n=1 Tax=Brassica cretica TaxID=69181 RepID=A0A8S9H928_BRACR|nr:hypothetical protein F2Q68_00017642 [Brassica cretica]